MNTHDLITSLTAEVNRLRKIVAKHELDRDTFVEHIAMLQRTLDGMRTIDAYAEAGMLEAP